jgi:hypothetical protein
MYRYCFILLVVAAGGAHATDGDEVDAHNHKGLFEAVDSADSLMVYNIIITCTMLAAFQAFQAFQGVRIGGR